MCAALRAGKNVVTANKQLMSERYGELVQLARENHVALRCSAGGGGGGAERVAGGRSRHGGELDNDGCYQPVHRGGAAGA